MKWPNYLSLHFLPVAAIWAAIFGAVGIVLYLTYRLLMYRLDSKRTLKALLITPPHFTSRPAAATQKLFTVLHGLNETRSLKDKLLHSSVIISIEVVSTKAHGIRYIVVASPRQVQSIIQALAVHLPDAKVTSCGLPTFDSSRSKVIEFYQTGHFAFPLDDTSEQGTDSIAYLTGVMANLSDNEAMHIQYVLQATQPREAAILRARLIRNENVIGQLSGSINKGIQLLRPLIARLALGLLDTLSMAYQSSSGYQRHGTTGLNYPLQSNDMQIARGQRPARTLSSHEQALADQLQLKLSQPLFKVAIRVAVEASDPKVISERLNTIKASMRAYQSPGHQSLKAKPIIFNQLYRKYMYQKRLPALLERSQSVLSASELAKLYTFTQSHTHRTDNLTTSMSRTLPAPTSLKREPYFDIVLGCNDHHGSKTLIGLSAKERERHVYIIGGTGNGKTTMLQNAIIQDIQHGKGLAIIDPHGDMAETILRHVPKHRINDVIYFNPDDLQYPIGLNLLELTPGLGGVELMREKDLITESVVSIFRKIFSEEDTGGHRIEYVLRNAVQTALTVEDATLFTIFDLLNNPKYRKKVVSKLESEELRNFWKYELGKAGDMQRIKMAAGITAKIGRFLFSASAKHILEQPHSTIDFDDILGSGKILVCNLSKGLLGEDTSELFGITILAKLQLAALKRARVPQTERRPFYLYVDEFQNFATASFVQLLSEARKYKLFMLMAEQSTSQQSDQQMVAVILANVGTIISFRSGNPADERLLLPLFTPYIQAGELANLPPFQFYAKLAATVSQEPLSGQTILLESEGSNDVASRVIKKSRLNYANELVINYEVSTEELPIESRIEMPAVAMPDQAN